MRSDRFVTRLDKYMFRQLFLALIVVTSGLTALIWLVPDRRIERVIEGSEG